jgi:hypothetical protein
MRAGLAQQRLGADQACELGTQELDFLSSHNVAAKGFGRPFPSCRCRPDPAYPRHDPGPVRNALRAARQSRNIDRQRGVGHHAPANARSDHAGHHHGVIAQNSSHVCQLAGKIGDGARAAIIDEMLADLSRDDEVGTAAARPPVDRDEWPWGMGVDWGFGRITLSCLI